MEKRVSSGANRKFCFTGVRSMSPIIKDSDTLATSETSSRPGSAAPGDPPTRPQPVALEVPVTVNGARTVEGGDKREPFSEATKTVMIHGNGAVIKLHSALAPGQLLFLTNERTKKEVVCQVVKSKNYRSVSGYVELEFTEPAVGFWGMRFPADRIAPGPQASPDASRPAATNGSPAPSRLAGQKVDESAAGIAPSGVAGRSSTPAPALSTPAIPALSGSSIVPAPIDSGSLLGTPNPRPDSGFPAVPLAPSFGSEEPLVEPWLKKREPASRVPAEPPSVAPLESVLKTEAPAPSHPPVRNFELARPSDKPASLFAPSEPPSNPATLDLSSLAPFFEVQPAPADMAPAAPPKVPAASDPDAEELKQHTTRLEQELSQLQLADQAESSSGTPAMDAPPVPVEEPAISLPKADPVHESAAQLLENPARPSAGAVLPDAEKLEEPSKVAPPAPIPALESLEEARLELPAWLAPLARNPSAPSSTNELVLREKAKRVREQPPLEELMAPLAAPIKKERSEDSHIPQFGSDLPFEGVKRVKENAPKKSGKGMLSAALVAVTALLAAGAWWSKSQQAGGVLAGVFSRQAPVASATARAKPDRSNANVPVNAAPASATAVEASNPESASDSDGGRALTTAEGAEPEAVPSAEKKAVLGEVHLEAPKLSPKRTAQTSLEPDLSEEPSEADANALGPELGASGKQPAAPATPVPAGGDVKQARLISSVPPEYPAMAKAQHVSGGVTIDALIDSNGRVARMKVLSGPTLLEQAAMDALRQWKYEPAKLDGKAVPMHLTVTIQFRLQKQR